MNGVARGRWVLLAIFALFAAPVGLAFAFYFGGGPGAASTNHGRLIDPARPVPVMRWRQGDAVVSARRALAGHWTMLVVARHGCRAPCRAALATSAHVRLLLHDDITRVQRILLLAAGTSSPRALQPDLKVYRSLPGNMAGVDDWLDRSGKTGPGTVYLIDPHGNGVMIYPPGEGGNGLFKDLKQLLRLSRIG